MTHTTTVTSNSKNQPQIRNHHPWKPNTEVSAQYSGLFKGITKMGPFLTLLWPITTEPRVQSQKAALTLLATAIQSFSENFSQIGSAVPLQFEQEEEEEEEEKNKQNKS